MFLLSSSARAYTQTAASTKSGHRQRWRGSLAGSTVHAVLRLPRSTRHAARSVPPFSFTPRGPAASDSTNSCPPRTQSTGQHHPQPLKKAKWRTLKVRAVKGKEAEGKEGGLAEQNTTPPAKRRRRGPSWARRKNVPSCTGHCTSTLDLVRCSCLFRWWCWQRGKAEACSLRKARQPPTPPFGLTGQVLGMSTSIYDKH